MILHAQILDKNIDKADEYENDRKEEIRMISIQPARENEKLCLSMYKKYIKELRRYDKNVLPDMDAFRRYFHGTHLLMLDDEVIGFVTCELVIRSGCPDIMQIRDLYILPQHRRKGYADQAVQVMERAWGKDIYLCVLKKNMVAKSFWAEMERSHKWWRIDRHDLEAPPGYDLRAFALAKPEFNKDQEHSTEVDAE